MGSIAYPLLGITASIQLETSKNNADQNSRLSKIAQIESIVKVTKDATNTSSHYLEGMAIVEFF